MGQVSEALVAISFRDIDIGSLLTDAEYPLEKQVAIRDQLIEAEKIPFLEPLLSEIEFTFQKLQELERLWALLQKDAETHDFVYLEREIQVYRASAYDEIDDRFGALKERRTRPAFFADAKCLQVMLHDYYP